MKENFNYPLIKSKIKKDHEHFIKYVGEIPAKISFDHQLMLHKFKTRIYFILENCFLKNNIIDEIKDIKDQISYSMDEDSFCYRIRKKNYDRSVYIWSNGKKISFQPSMSLINLINQDNERMLISDIDFYNYDWVDFSDKLLYYIHKIIYAQAKSYETKIFY